MDRQSSSADEGRFGLFLRRHRERRHLTLDEVEALSSNLGNRISKSNLSRLENARAPLNLAKLGTLALVYDVPLSEMVERYEIDRRLQKVPNGSAGKNPRQVVDAAIACARSGDYLGALAVARRARERLETGNGNQRLHASRAEYRRLFLTEIQSLLHLGFYECGRVDAERFLALEEIGIEETLLAWHGFIACSVRLERFEVAAATIDHAEELLRSPEVPPRFHADFALLRGNLLAATARHESAVEAYSLALKRFEALPRPYEVCRCRVMLGGALTELGKYRNARAQLARARATAERWGYHRLNCLALSNACKLGFRLSRHREAESLAIRSNRIARRLDYEPVLFRNTWYLLKIAEARANEPAARRLERILLQHLGKMPNSMPEARAFREILSAGRRRQGEPRE